MIKKTFLKKISFIKNKNINTINSIATLVKEESIVIAKTKTHKTSMIVFFSRFKSRSIPKTQ